MGSANAPGDGQKKTSLTTAAEVCYYELGKVTKDSPQSRCFGNYCQCQVPPQVIDPQLCETNIISFTVMKLPGEGWGLSGSK